MKPRPSRRDEGDVLALEPAVFPYLLHRTLEVGGEGDQLEEAVGAQFARRSGEN